MRFASQEFFGKLKEAILNDNGDDSIYTELYEVLLHDTRYRIIRNVGFQEWEDVFQEVVWAVIRQLPRYLMNSENMHESQRQSWLNLIVDRKSASWLEKINEMNKQKKNKKKQDDVKVSKQQVGRALSFDMLQELNEKTKSPIKLAHEPDSTKNPETLVLESEISDELLDKLHELYSINTAPDKLIAFTYSKLIFPYMGDEVNGKPSKVQERLHGIKLYRLYECMIDDLRFAIDGVIPQEVFLPLREKLDMIDADGRALGEHLFKLPARQISDGLHRIQKKWISDSEEKSKKDSQEGGSDDDDRTPGL